MLQMQLTNIGNQHISTLISYSLGKSFAQLEAITITSMLMQKFTFELVEPDVEPRYLPALTLPMETGLPMRVKHRTKSE